MPPSSQQNDGGDVLPTEAGRTLRVEDTTHEPFAAPLTSSIPIAPDENNDVGGKEENVAAPSHSESASHSPIPTDAVEEGEEGFETTTTDDGVIRIEAIIASEPDSAEEEEDIQRPLNTVERVVSHAFVLSRDELESVKTTARKVGVGVAGGTLVTAGVVLAPLPTPAGEVLAVAGVGVLATEFPAAQRVIDGARDRVANFIDGLEEVPTMRGESARWQDGGAEEQEEEEGEGGDEEERQQKQPQAQKITARSLSTAGVEGATRVGRKLRNRAVRAGKSIRPMLDKDAEMPEMPTMDDAKQSVRRQVNWLKGQGQKWMGGQKVVPKEEEEGEECEGGEAGTETSDVSTTMPK